MLKRAEITVSETMVCIYCGQEFDGCADLCLCLTQQIQEALTPSNALRANQEIAAREDLEL